MTEGIIKKNYALETLIMINCWILVILYSRAVYAFPSIMKSAPSRFTITMCSMYVGCLENPNAGSYRKDWSLAIGSDSSKPTGRLERIRLIRDVHPATLHGTIDVAPIRLRNLD
jgi:hypothetical protein